MVNMAQLDRDLRPNGQPGLLRRLLAGPGDPDKNATYVILLNLDSMRLTRYFPTRSSPSASSRLPAMALGRHGLMTLSPLKAIEVIEGGVAMRTYERPTLTLAGSFKKMTGIGGSGPRDALVQHQFS
jgi:hypothetical protein